MAISREACALFARIDCVLRAIPLLKKRLEDQDQPATKKRTRRKRGTGLPPGITQLGFSWQDGDQAHEQDQAG